MVGKVKLVERSICPLLLIKQPADAAVYPMGEENPFFSQHCHTFLTDGISHQVFEGSIYFVTS